MPPVATSLANCFLLPQNAGPTSYTNSCQTIKQSNNQTFKQFTVSPVNFPANIPPLQQTTARYAFERSHPAF